MQFCYLCSHLILCWWVRDRRVWLKSINRFPYKSSLIFQNIICICTYNHTLYYAFSTDLLWIVFFLNEKVDIIFIRLWASTVICINYDRLVIFEWVKYAYICMYSEIKYYFIVFTTHVLQLSKMIFNCRS